MVIVLRLKLSRETLGMKLQYAAATCRRLRFGGTLLRARQGRGCCIDVVFVAHHLQMTVETQTLLRSMVLPTCV